MCFAICTNDWNYERYVFCRAISMVSSSILKCEIIFHIIYIKKYSKVVWRIFFQIMLVKGLFNYLNLKNYTSVHMQISKKFAIYVVSKIDISHSPINIWTCCFLFKIPNLIRFFHELNASMEFTVVFAKRMSLSGFAELTSSLTQQTEHICKFLSPNFF